MGPINVEDIVRLRKAHPCGGNTWRITRVGADIGMVCATCGRKVLLTHEEFERRCVGRSENTGDEKSEKTKEG
jgi:hypothetical protein